MFTQLLKFELNYHMKRWSFLIMLIFSALAGIQSYHKLNANQDLISNSSPYNISVAILLITLASIFVAIFFSINSAIRDRQAQFEDIIFTTSVSKKDFYLTRFIGVFISTLFVISFFLIGLFVGEIVFFDDTVKFESVSFFLPWMILLLPNVFICSAMAFLIAIHTKNTTYTYIASIGVFLLYWVCSMISGSPLTGANMMANPSAVTIISFIDFFGLTAFF